jgi:predicted MFS family arabinose efflux permease
MHSTSTWFTLRNPVFLRIWVANVLSATFISAQDVTATWLMHDLGASFSLSLLATATSTPLLLFALPAGIIADMTNRKTLILCAVAWQAAFSGLLAAGAWTKMLSINSVLFCVFGLGIGIAFSAPVWSAIVPDIVSKEELPSAVTLGGVQVNIAGIIGPALGGFLLPMLGAPLLVSINALTLLIVCLVILPWKPRQTRPDNRSGEGFVDSFLGSLRYAAKSARIRIVLFRNLLFSLAISAIPALLPVIVYTELKGSAAQLGLAFTCVAAGSLLGAVIVLPFLRQRISPNAITLVAMGIMPVLLMAMAVVRNQVTIPAYSAIAGVAWALAGSELWLAGQRVVSGRVRGRMNAYLIMAGQGGIALGSILLAAGAAHAGLHLALVLAAGLALVGFGLGYRFSINFPHSTEETAEPSKEPDEEAVGYFIDSLRRMAGYEKCAGQPDRSEREGQK